MYTMTPTAHETEHAQEDVKPIAVKDSEGNAGVQHKRKV